MAAKQSFNAKATTKAGYDPCVTMDYVCETLENKRAFKTELACEPLSQVEHQLQLLEDRIGETVLNVQTVIDRLGTLLMPEPVCPDESEVARPGLVPAAARLRNYNDQLDGVNTELVSLLNRLEL